jgi:hypothetical protein
MANNHPPISDDSLGHSLDPWQWDLTAQGTALDWELTANFSKYHRATL